MKCDAADRRNKRAKVAGTTLLRVLLALVAAVTWCTTRGHPALIQDFEPLDSTQPPRWLSSAVKLDSTSAIKKGWTGADVLRGRVFISSVFLSISGNGDKFIFR